MVIVKTFRVFVFYHPKEEGSEHPALWLGYTRYQGCAKSKSYIGAFDVQAENRDKAIRQAIAQAKGEK